MSTQKINCTKRLRLATDLFHYAGEEYCSFNAMLCKMLNNYFLLEYRIDHVIKNVI